MRAKGPLLPWFPALWGIGVIAGIAARAQFLEPPDTNFFGDNSARTFDASAGGIAIDNDIPRPAKPEGFESLLLFKDGRQLRGRLEKVDKEEITWRRPDFSGPIRLWRSDVRRVYLAPDAESAMNPFMPGVIPHVPTMAGETPNAVVPATVKLDGNDWLQGELTSPDGQNFTVRLDKKGTSITAPRSRIEWLFFDSSPARGGGFDGSVARAEAWLALAPSAKLADDGTLVIAKEDELFGRSLPQPRLFEISMEIPADSELGYYLSLSPSPVDRDTFTGGIANVGFGPKQLSLCRLTRGNEHRTFPVSESGGEELNGMVRYRIFYDSDTQRLVVFRNDRNVADWKPGEAKPGNHPGIESITLSEVPIYPGQRLKLHRFQVSPWDGTLPAAKEIPTTEDQLSTGASGSVAGKLERITDKEVVFSAQSEPRRAGMFIRLAHESGAPFEPVARIELVDTREVGMRPFEVWSLNDWLRNQSGAGELSISALEIRDGKAHLRTAFADDLELPASALNAISFPSLSPHSPMKGDCLVFKNGDELPGALISAGHDSPLRWKMPGGQEVAIDLKYLAGVRLATPAPLKTAEKSAWVELRNGDRLRGNVISFDEHRLGFKALSLGLLSVDHSQLWKLFPLPGAETRDGADNPASWITAYLNAGPFESSDLHGPFDRTLTWLHLDGCYVPRPPNGRFGLMFLSTLLPPHSTGLFEVRVEITEAGGNFSNSIVSIGGKMNDDDDVPSISVNICRSELSVCVRNVSRRPKDWHISLGQKFRNISNRLSFRIFVNSVLGTADIMLNGVGPMRLPAASVSAIAFGGEYAPAHAAARLRLVDGSIVHATAFDCRDGAITGGSDTLGLFHLPLESVAEIIFDPPPLRGSPGPPSKKLTQPSDSPAGAAAVKRQESQ